MDTFLDILKVLGGIILAIIGSLGYGKLREMREKRKYDLHDSQAVIHESNTTEQTKAEVTLVQALLRRVEVLETANQSTQERLMTFTETNTELRIRNEHLEKENDKKDAQIEEQRGRIKALEMQVTELSVKVEAMGRVADMDEILAAKEYLQKKGMQELDDSL